MWKPEHRRGADRCALRYPSDLADAEWTLVAPLIRPAKRDRRKRMVNVREVLNAIFYMLSTGCQWDTLPLGLPAQHGVEIPGPVGLGRHNRAHRPCPLRPEPGPGRPGGQPDHGDHRRPERQRGRSLDPRGYDAGKKVLGRKRHVLVDALGLLLSVEVHVASVENRDGPERCCVKRADASCS